MGLVSVLAIVFAILGWLVVILTLLFTLSGGLITAQVTKSPQAGFMVAGILAPFALSSLGLFFAWGILRGFCALHAQGEETLVLLEELEFERAKPRSRRRSAAANQSRSEDAIAMEPDGPPDWVPQRGQKMKILRDTTLFDKTGLPGKAMGAIPRSTEVTVISVLGEKWEWVSIRTSYGEEGLVAIDDLEPVG